MKLSKKEKKMEKAGVVFVDVSKCPTMTQEEQGKWDRSQRFEPKTYRETEDGFPQDWQ
jgi:hypothetical protein